jgi:hypothetical protein
VSLLEKHGQLILDDPTPNLLLQASVSTVERNLKVLQQGLVGRKISQTKGQLAASADPGERGQAGRQGCSGVL